ncbi:pyridoxamine 5'-phosphate oxidase family protein [Spirosoma aureum]|uniref:Pyridoxamine 5'-phosphate oxidase family protein n=1 Tax=Spirosoma aureum TaxID=2692134 RepID=A0A6G9AMU8_9BACT|nr:pyridoxamine 5'-phosphate oxidase family protein [Spirosoma aureum]QIP13730.1 pyridoxamine 5'-phosphate oxidase family protein [Spirosoma aureum]
MRFTLSPRVTDHVLSSQLFGHLGTNANGQLMIWPVTYLFDGQAIYGQIQEDELTSLLQTNPNVCFEVSELTNPFDWRSVVIQGIYEELQGEERRYVEQLLGPARISPMLFQPTLDLAHFELPATIVYRIRIRNKTGYHQVSQVQPVNSNCVPA